MKELNIAKTLVSKRREKGITQDELAAYIGVSKASVSKWETGQSYPDILFLPPLAAYFNISIDELIGYAPQMMRGEIRRLCLRLVSDFAEKPFEEVLADCHDLIKKYYSCFPLLMQMAVLFTNHLMLATDSRRREEILQEAISLCVRVKAESDDVWLAKDATSLEAACYLLLQQPQVVLDLLGESIRPQSLDAELIAQAHELTGNRVKAKQVLQIGMYQSLLQLVGSTPSYLLLNTDDAARVDEIVRRTIGVAELFDLDKLHPNIMAQVYLASAQAYCMLGNAERAMDMLQGYSDLCTTKFFPYSLHGDVYFDAIGGWFEDFSLGTSAPRSEKLIRASMVQALTANPAFATLADEPRFADMVENLKANLGGD